ncbi:MAG TPA: cellulose-binding protein, partial [Trebonia sp.]
DADQHARQLVSNAKKNADQIVAQAKAQAETAISEAKSEAERRRLTAQREVEELTRQKDNITTHLAQVRQLLGGQLGIQMPPMEAAVAPAPVQPAVESAPVGSSAAPVARPVSNGAARPATAAGEGKANDEDWWTE